MEASDSSEAASAMKGVGSETMGAPWAQFNFPLDAATVVVRARSGDCRPSLRLAARFDLGLSRLLLSSRSAPGGAAGSEGRRRKDTPPPGPVAVGRREPGGGATSGVCRRTEDRLYAETFVARIIGNLFQHKVN